MAKLTRNLVLGATIAAMLAGGGALVRAQQSQTVAPPDSAAPTPTEEAPPPDSALSAAEIVPPAPPGEASDVEPAPPPASAVAESAQSSKVEQLKRPRYAAAVIQALDKVTAQTLRFEVPVNKPIRYKSLIFVVRACETTASDEAFSDAAAHVEIDSQPLPPDGKAPPPAKQIFRGWMFANSPGVDLFQHPVYDAWLIACKTDAPSA